MDLTDPTTIAWIVVGTIVALAIVAAACYLAWMYANDEEIV